ncbi:hypothetical protein AYK20_03485 [Thermoplasmatales archaeon SG8-52-1]|nr:MAG: hypothetical protein AYK20_03485 [Thermoplasmatales archaeon SG8-52-1]
MSKLSNVDILENVMNGLFTTAGTRTSKNFAVAVINAITRALEQRYDFLKYVKFDIKGNSNDFVYISPDLNSIELNRLGQAVEAIIKVICMDFKDKAGLYFINELKKNTGNETIFDLKSAGIDFDLLQIQQHYLFRQRERIKSKSKESDGFLSKKEKSLLNYSWENVSDWNYDSNNRNCKIYDKNGKVLDELNLDEIVKKYIKYLTDENSVENSTNYKMDEKEKSLKIKKFSE